MPNSIFTIGVESTLTLSRLTNTYLPYIATRIEYAQALIGSTKADLQQTYYLATGFEGKETKAQKHNRQNLIQACEQVAVVKEWQLESYQELMEFVYA